MKNDDILVIKNLSKTFPGVKALDDVQFSCEKGETHALIGENGAGKSTLLKIIAGIHRPDEGEIYFDGSKVSFKHPIDARNAGIAMVHQELSVLPELTVAQNVYLNEERQAVDSKKRSFFINEKALREKTAVLAAEYGIEVEPNSLTKDLPLAKQQMVEIMKVLVQNPKLIILDEPTSALGREEVDKLYQIVETMREKGITIIFISHRMEEVFRFAQRATVFKDGKYVATIDMSDVTENDIIKLMVGRELQSIFPAKRKNSSDEVIFEAKNVAIRGKNNSLHIKQGEIVALAGLQGQGQSELLQALAGVDTHGGEVYIHGEQKKYKTVKAALKAGVAFIPEDRKRHGLCLMLSIRENIALASLDSRVKCGLIDRTKENEVIKKNADKMNIKTPSYEQFVVNLSGGNQQKVVLSKALASGPQVLLFNEPTRGIDVDAKREIYFLMRELANEGKAILLYSSDLMEVVGLSDRVLPMYEYEIMEELTGEDITEEKIMSSSMGFVSGGKG